MELTLLLVILTEIYQSILLIDRICKSFSLPPLTDRVSRYYRYCDYDLLKLGEYTCRFLSKVQHRV